MPFSCTCSRRLGHPVAAPKARAPAKPLPHERPYARRDDPPAKARLSFNARWGLSTMWSKLEHADSRRVGALQRRISWAWCLEVTPGSTHTHTHVASLHIVCSMAPHWLAVVGVRSYIRFEGIAFVGLGMSIVDSGHRASVPLGLASSPMGVARRHRSALGIRHCRRGAALSPK